MHTLNAKKYSLDTRRTNKTKQGRLAAPFSSLSKLSVFDKNGKIGTACSKNLNNCLNTNPYSYLETSGG